jgi:succinate-semialdehyde dehydrogenase/glutarate-semialdehyde dehydrogenase
MTTIDLSDTRVAAVLDGVPTGMFVGGGWGPSSDGSVIDVFDPATEQLLTRVANGTTEDATRAVDAAAAAMPGWAATAPRVRAETLRRAFDIMTARADQFARLIVLENGKSLTDARGEVAYAAEFFRWYSEEAVRNIGEIMTAPNGSNKIMVTNHPVGVALLITPWNFPAAMLTRKIGPALAAGCAIVCKPASETPLTALLIAKVLEDAGVPAGVVNVVASNRSSAFARTTLADPRVRKLSFTGSTEVGRALLATASETIVNCSMELGGNAPFLVFDDADLDAAIAGAMIAKMRNGGEACTAANRFYVQRGIADAFSARLAEAMSALKVGHGLDDGTQVGPMVNAASRDKIDELVNEALAGGARALIGGQTPTGTGHFYPPTVLRDVAPGADVLSNEIFGPVAPIVIFDTEDEAIALANDTEYGLVSYLYTADYKRGLRVADRLDAGMIGFNQGIVSDPAAPFGGTKQSGIGREGGHEGMMEYLEPKYVAVAW